MKTFFYTVNPSSSPHFCRVTIFRVKRNVPTLVASGQFDIYMHRANDDRAIELIRGMKLIPKADISPATGKANWQLIYLNTL